MINLTLAYHNCDKFTKIVINIQYLYHNCDKLTVLGVEVNPGGGRPGQRLAPTNTLMSCSLQVFSGQMSAVRCLCLDWITYLHYIVLCVLASRSRSQQCFRVAFAPTTGKKAESEEKTLRSKLPMFGAVSVTIYSRFYRYHVIYFEVSETNWQIIHLYIGTLAHQYTLFWAPEI